MNIEEIVEVTYRALLIICLIHWAILIAINRLKNSREAYRWK